MWIGFFLPALVTIVRANDVRLIISPSANPLQKPAGQQVSLICSVENGGEKPGLLWTKNGAFVNSPNIVVSKLDSSTISLTIRDATTENSGVYTCNAQLNGSLVQKTVDVIVFEDYHFVDKTTKTGHVMATAAVNISCEVAPRKEQFTTTWSRIGHPNWAPGLKHRLYQGGAILEILNYDSQLDAGDYACKVVDATTSATLSRKITVGSEIENKRMFCTNMCTNICHQLYQPPVF